MLDYFSVLYNQNTNDHYLHRYVTFILKIKLLGNRQLSYSEEHHIIPRCIDKTYYNHIDNRVKLTAREHYIAHRLLVRCYNLGSREYKVLVCALIAMSKLNSETLQRDDIKVNSKVYAKLSEQYAEVMKEIQTERMITGHWDKFIGRGKPSPNRGKISITDGVSNRYVDVDFKIPDGWYRGSTQHREHLNHSEMMKNAWQRNRDNRVGKNHPMYGKGDLLKGEKNGRYGVKLIYMNNGIKNKMVKPEEVSMYTAKGFVKGMIKKR